MYACNHSQVTNDELFNEIVKTNQFIDILLISYFAFFKDKQNSHFKNVSDNFMNGNVLFSNNSLNHELSASETYYESSLSFIYSNNLSWGKGTLELLFVILQTVFIFLYHIFINDYNHDLLDNLHRILFYHLLLFKC